MKRGTRKVVWQKKNKDYVVGVIRQRGEPDTIVIKIRKEAVDKIRIAMDTIPPMEQLSDPTAEELAVDRENRIKSLFQALNLPTDQLPWMNA